MSSRYDERRQERIARRLEELRAWRNAREHPIADWSFTAGDGETTRSRLGDFWPVVETPVQFAASGAVPEAWAGEPVELELWLGGEGFVRLSTGLPGRARSVPPQLSRRRAARGRRADRDRGRGRAEGDVRQPRRRAAAGAGPLRRSPARGAGAGAGPDDDRPGRAGAGRPRGRAASARRRRGGASPISVRPGRSASDDGAVAAGARLRQPDRQRRRLGLRRLRGRGVRRPPLLDADLASAAAAAPAGAAAGRGARGGRARPRRGRAAAGTAQAGLPAGRAAGADRPRPHRPGLALAGGRDAAQGAAHLRHRARPDGALPRFHLQPVLGAALRLDRGGRSRPLRAGQGAGRRGALGADRRLVGRAGLPGHRRRVVRPPAPLRAARLREPGSASARRWPGCRTSSASRAASRNCCAAPGSTASSRSS